MPTRVRSAGNPAKPLPKPMRRPDTMNVRKELVPIFCANCGERIGWEVEAYENYAVFFCEDCAKLPRSELSEELQGL